MVPKYIRSQSLEPVNITLFGKRVFADVILCRILRWEVYLGLSEWALNVIMSVIFFP